MNEWLRRLIEQIRTTWQKWSTTQKLILVGVLGAAVLAVVLLVVFSTAPASVRVFDVPVTDPVQRTQILLRLEEEGIDASANAEGFITVADEITARRAGAILIREDLVTADVDPWDLFDVERWTQTDFERNINLRRAIQRELELHLEALDDIDTASVNLTFPEDELFAEDQDPVTASIVISPRPGSDIRENRTKVEGIQRLVQFAIEGLMPENITINDSSGVRLNDFENLADVDDLERRRRELQIERDIERQYIDAILTSLSAIYRRDRVEIVNLDVELDFGRRTTERQEFSPIVTVEDNPETPFSEEQFVLSIERSREEFSETFQGSGINPEGPPGVEGQVPPAFQDLDNIFGDYDRQQTVVNNEINSEVTVEEGTPSVRRVSAAVAIDGVWRVLREEDGQIVVDAGEVQRQYTALTPEEIADARDLVEHAVGYSVARGDSVSVRNIQFDRTEEFQEEDAALLRQQNVQRAVLLALLSIAILLVAFIIFRLVSREVERRRRLREEELARQHQAMREAALRSAEEEGAEVEMSVEDRARLELQEDVINLARERPEDVARLVRTWLLEE